MRKYALISLLIGLFIVILSIFFWNADQIVFASGSNDVEGATFTATFTPTEPPTSTPTDSPTNTPLPTKPSDPTHTPTPRPKPGGLGNAEIFSITTLIVPLFLIFVTFFMFKRRRKK